jgi:hypothetical protein
MTLGNMRANGMRSLAVMCHRGRQKTVLNVDYLSGDLTGRSGPAWPPPEPRQFGAGSPFALHPLESRST